MLKCLFYNNIDQIFEKKKQVKKPFLGTLWKNLTEKLQFFFGERSPSKLVFIGAQAALEKF